jgi:hypothetical protein
MFKSPHDRRPRDRIDVLAERSKLALVDAVEAVLRRPVAVMIGQQVSIHDPRVLSEATLSRVAV